MTQIIATGSAKENVRKATVIDMTPMVDLGFLLITFFVFTAALSENNIMKLVVPKPSDSTMDVPASKAFTIVLGPDHSVHYYEGGPGRNKIKKTSYDEIRSLIMNRNSVLNGKIIVMIHPSEDSDYRNLVNAIDEMQICGVKNWFLMDASKEAELAAKEI